MVAATHPLPACPSLRFGLVMRVFRTPAMPRTLSARDALILEFLPLADASGGGFSRQFAGLIEREDAIQVARLALTTAVSRLSNRSTAQAFLRATITGALRHHLRDRVRLVRVSRREHEKGTTPFRHESLDQPQPKTGLCLLDLIPAEASAEQSEESGKLEAMLDQLPANQAAVLRLHILQGLSIRQAAEAMGVSHTTAHRLERKALASLRAELA